jgi:uncharacterized heparinase superfamily protein
VVLAYGDWVIRTASCYYHTIRHLRARQVWGRLRLWLPRARPDTNPAPTLRQMTGRWQTIERTPSLLGPDHLRLLNLEYRIATADDWDRADRPLLWRYNAHYFDDLLADQAATRSAWHQVLIMRWITENPPGRGTAWAPYPTSLRIVNWIGWHWSVGALSDAARHSLAVQARWLAANLEEHLLGNHLWSNAKALLFAGVAFTGTESETWRRTALQLLHEELAEQLLADGGHNERSPMYHALFVADLLDLVQLADLAPGLLPSAQVDQWRAAVPRALGWLATMSHPDGGPALFNDTALGVAPTLAALGQRAEALQLAAGDAPRLGVSLLPASGFCRLENEHAVVFVDVGSVGPAHLPGHAHAGTLSVEASLDGVRTLVNSGISTYEEGPERLAERGTAAHNTMVVDDQDSSAVWRSFRVGRRARVHDVSSETSEHAGSSVRAWHDGYDRTFARRRVERHVVLLARQLLVTDTMRGPHRHAEAHWRMIDSGAVKLDTVVGDATTSAGMWHPQFNKKGHCVHTRIVARGGKVVTRVTW